MLICVRICVFEHSCVFNSACLRVCIVFFVSVSVPVVQRVCTVCAQCVHSVCMRREGPQCMWVTLLGPIISCLDHIYSLGFHSSCLAKLMATSINDLTAAFGHWPADPGALGQSHAAPVTYGLPAAVPIGGGRRD